MNKLCYQINLSELAGGGEIYTHFFSKALRACGWDTVVFVNRHAAFWGAMDFGGITLAPVAGPEEIVTRMPAEKSLVIAHVPLRGAWAEALRDSHVLAAIAHHPMYGGNERFYKTCALVFAISRHVISTLEKAGITQFYPEPLYGAADMSRLGGDTRAPLFAAPLYQWDRRKLRDVALSMLDLLYQRVKPAARYDRKPGLTLGIVSRIAPAKQFPEMFRVLGPIIRRVPGVNLEIFGSGVGYAPVRDLRASLAPIKDRVRFWGPQRNMRAVYASLDFLMSGLPEREGLGLNLIEAQLCGTPVLAVNAPPFSEIVAHEETGFLFADPRADGGRDFESLLAKLAGGGGFPGPLRAAAHLRRFSMEKFTARVKDALDYARARFSAPK